MTWDINRDCDKRMHFSAGTVIFLLKYRGSSNSAEICPKIFVHYAKPRCLNLY